VRRVPAQVSTKGGCKRRGDGSASTSWDFGYVLRPADVALAIAASAAAVGGGFTVMWSLHNTDAYDATGDDFRDVLRAMRGAAEAGSVQMLGLSNATCAHVRAAGPQSVPEDSTGA
jgi:aryl-alcohol dehydrogenase-like predicted oxidoreductase